jgi:hypothetical protein
MVPAGGPRLFVMAGLDPAIQAVETHAYFLDSRVKRGYDGAEWQVLERTASNPVAASGVCI